MRLSAPTAAPEIKIRDTEGKPVVLSDGEYPTLLCFFRDPACPFCNLRIYELTQRHAAFTALGLKVVAVFSATPEQVKRFVARKSRPFQVVADPDPQTYESYGIERSFWRKLKAVVTRVPSLLRGLRIVGLAGFKTNNLLPADFLLDETGRIVEAWYGRDAGDRMPFDNIELFLARNLVQRQTRPAASGMREGKANA